MDDLKRKSLTPGQVFDRAIAMVLFVGLLGVIALACGALAWMPGK